MSSEAFKAGISLFNGGATALKTIRDVVLKLSGEVDQDARNQLNRDIGALLDRMQEMREAYRTLSNENSAMEDRIAELNDEIGELRKFEADIQDYTLQKLGPDTYAYVRHDAGKAVEDGVPCLCAHCFDRKKKSLLQFEKAELHAHVLACHECGSRVRKTVDDGPAVMIVPVRKPEIW